MKLDKNIYNNTLEFFKKRFFELIGLILLSIFLIFLYSLFTYSPENSTLIYNSETQNTNVTFKIYLNLISDFFLQSFGLISFLISISMLSWGINLIMYKKISNVLRKTFYIIIYITFGCIFVYATKNESFWLIDNGNSGFIGEKIFNFIYSFIPIIENDLSKILFLLVTLVFFFRIFDQY